MWGILFLLGAFGVDKISAGYNCNPESIDPDWKKCDMQYLVSEENETEVEHMCKRVDCMIQCKTDAVGECQTREEFRQHLMKYDTVKWKILYRITCANAHLQEFVQECVDNSVCTQDEINKAFTDKTDKNALCSMYAKIRKCVDRSPKGKCTADVAKFDEEVRRLGYSLSICENTDIKHLYQKYGGDVNCGASSNDGSSSAARLSSALYIVNLMLLYRCVNVLQRQLA